MLVRKVGLVAQAGQVVCVVASHREINSDRMAVNARPRLTQHTQILSWPSKDRLPFGPECRTRDKTVMQHDLGRVVPRLCLAFTFDLVMHSRPCEWVLGTTIDDEEWSEPRPGLADARAHG